MPVITLSSGLNFEAERGTTLLDAALARGVMLEHSCRTGRCGTCKAKVKRGATAPLRDPVALALEDIANGWVLTCVHEALSDVELDIEELDALAGLKCRVTPARINALTLLSPDVMRIEMRLPPRNAFRFLAGQYIDVTGPSGATRSYSIASASTSPERVELQVRRVDQGALSTYWFEQAKVNDLLRFNGPRGTFYLRPSEGLDLIFLATGTGIAPVHSMLQQLATMPTESRPRSVTLYWGGRHVHDLYLDADTGLYGLRYVPVLSRADVNWTGAQGHVQDVLVHDMAHGKAPPLQGAAVYACGSEAMIHGARRLLSDNGLLSERFFSDAFVSSD